MERERIVVVGAGTMGHGIAQVAAMSGYSTVLVDVDRTRVERGIASIRSNLDTGVERGKVDPEVRDRALESLELETDLRVAARDAAWVVEAVPEDLELKKTILADLGDAAPPSAILATNTSSLPVGEIGSASGRPDRVIGLHFFNPVHIMKLLEIVRAEATSPETLTRARELGERLGKTCIVVRDSPGFATSRLGLVLGLEAIRMLEAEVASAEDIDTAMTLGYRHPIGPLRLTDLVGLDVRLAIAEHLHTTLGSEAFRPPALLRRLVAEGRLGKKTGSGFYRWED